jgi:DNA-binding IclR family transcriptional regulator
MTDPLCQVSHLHLARYMAATGRPVALAVLRNRRVRYPQVLFPAGHPAAASFRTGDALASRTAAGKLLLAYRHGVIDVVPSPQPHLRPAVTGWGNLGPELRRIRHEGVAFASEEHVPDEHVERSRRLARSARDEGEEARVVG